MLVANTKDDSVKCPEEASRAGKRVKMCRVAHLTAKAKGPAKPAVTPEVMSAAAAVTCTVLAIAGLTSSARANGDMGYHFNLVQSYSIHK